MADRAELVKRLNDEGDFGADYIEELLNIADLDGDIEIGIEADRASVAVVTEGVADRRLKRLIGQGGQVLDALQELTRLAVQAKTGERSRLMLDIADYRESHRQEVAAIAQEAVASVLANSEPVSLAPTRGRCVAAGISHFANTLEYGVQKDGRRVGCRRPTHRGNLLALCR